MGEARRVLIIGGVAGGASAAARLRRLDESARITIVERTGYVSYANCGLPYFVGDVITDQGKLTLQTPESFARRFGIEVRVRQEAAAIDRVAKRVRIRDLESGAEYDEPYDKLILSPGAKPVIPDIPGVDDDHVFTLRTVEDTLAIHDFLEREKPLVAAVVGGGFIGLEMAENLVERGLAVRVFQRPDHVMPTLDADMAAVLQNHLRAHGMGLTLGADVVAIERTCNGEDDETNGEASCTTTSAECGANEVAGAIGAGEHPLVVRLRDGSGYAADMVILAIGVRPESSLAGACGLELGVKGSIVVDEHMRTSDPDIYAVGDAVQVRHVVTGAAANVALAGPANRQGRIAADSICGIERSYAGSQGTAVMKAFEMTVATTGLNERTARSAGFDVESVVLSPASHATYYPGAKSMRLKVTFERGTGRLLGAQAVGYDGVDKRIDVLAAAIRAGMDGRDLVDLELAYAPPYSSAKDPVNMAGFMIENVLDGLVKQVTWADVEARPDDVVLVDVRSPAERERGCVPGSIGIPVDELRGRVSEIRRDKTLYIHCQSGLRSYLACRMLAQLGYDCANVAGGYLHYESIKLDRDMREEGAGPCGLVS